MKFDRIRLFSCLACLAFASAVLACDQHKKEGTQGTPAAAQAGDSKAAPCHGGSAEAKTASGGCAKKCGLNKSSGRAGDILASLPTMKFRVGNEVVDCCKSAEALSMKADAPIKYLVGEKAFDSKAEATSAMTAVLEERLADMRSVHMSVSGKLVGCSHAAQQMAKEANTTVGYVVAGVEYKDAEKAEKAAKLASEAASGLKIGYKVGDESFCCDKMASARVKETGKPLTYVVAGEETCCEQTAKMMLAQAKIKAMVEAAVAAVAS